MASIPRRPASVFAYNLCLPGALMPPIARRMKELKSGNLSRYVIELVAFDLCRLRAHSLTGPIAQKPLHVQHAVDLAIDRNYVDGKRSNKEQMDRIAKMGPEEVAALGDLGPVKKEKHRVWLRSLHREAVIERSAELGFPDIGEYITSLIRFDLLLGGPHDKFPGDKQFNRAEVLELDKITLEIYEANKPRKCMVDYVVEEIAGRPMTPEEHDAELRKVSEKLCEKSVQSHKGARKASA